MHKMDTLTKVHSHLVQSDYGDPGTTVENEEEKDPVNK